jgi:hypothetical protein
MKNSFFKGVAIGSCAFFIILGTLMFTASAWLQPSFSNDFLSKSGCWKNDVAKDTYFRALSSRGGYLVFGTSESRGLNTKPTYPNYWAYLGMTKENAGDIGVIAGAGHTPVMWMALIDHVPDDLPVLCIVNPIYFASSLNSEASIAAYAPRYLSRADAARLVGRLDAMDGLEGADTLKRIYTGFIAQDRKGDDGRIAAMMAYARFSLMGAWSRIKGKRASSSLQICPTVDPDYDTRFNVAKWVVERDDLGHQDVAVAVDDFRHSPIYDSYIAFLDYARARGKHVVLVLLPFNDLYFGSTCPTAVPEFERAMDVFRDDILSRTDHIDLSRSLSTRGFFVDSMHLSGFGAFQVYKSIKEALPHFIGTRAQ